VRNIPNTKLFKEIVLAQNNLRFDQFRYLFDHLFSTFELFIINLSSLLTHQEFIDFIMKGFNEESYNFNVLHCAVSYLKFSKVFEILKRILSDDEIKKLLRVKDSAQQNLLNFALTNPRQLENGNENWRELCDILKENLQNESDLKEMFLEVSSFWNYTALTQSAHYRIGNSFEQLCSHIKYLFKDEKTQREIFLHENLHGLTAFHFAIADGNEETFKFATKFYQELVGGVTKMRKNFIKKLNSQTFCENFLFYVMSPKFLYALNGKKINRFWSFIQKLYQGKRLDKSFDGKRS
jgi:hypothetical protein